jgi:hypothetical protein
MSQLKQGVLFHICNLSPIIDDISACNRYLAQHDLPRPKAKTDEGYKARLLCPKWWVRTLDRLQYRHEEATQIKLGRVGQRRQVYSSDTTFRRVSRRAFHTHQMLKDMVMQSDDGDTVDMATIMEHSLANPTNRRAELMIRMAGFEIYAQQNGFVGEFYTLTCPSKYHRFSGGALNPVYDHTPKEAQEYLCKQWAKIRAQFAREEITPFGFRVAEPHKDGCPHWHMLLFLKAEQRLRAREIMAQYALEIDGDEKGAAPYEGYDHTSKKPFCGARFNVVEIDADVGTATGYIAKYISKNLGFSIDDIDRDITDKSKDYGQRVKAWSSVWGIRQFQQIGGAPVGVWRQLRKLDAPVDGVIEEARQAADQSQWAAFLEIMGCNKKRADREIQLLKKKQIDMNTGELNANRYQEVLDVIYGVTAVIWAIPLRFPVVFEAITRKKNWFMTSAKRAVSSAGQGGAAAPRASWSPVNNCTA